MADLMAFLLLGRQHLVRQLPQTFLELQGILQQPGVAFAAFLEGGFHDLAPDDAPPQLAVGGGQFHGAPSKLFGQLPQMGFGLPRRLMSFFDRRDGFGEKNVGPRHEPVFSGG